MTLLVLSAEVTANRPTVCLSIMKEQNGVHGRHKPISSTELLSESMLLTVRQNITSVIYCGSRKLVSIKSESNELAFVAICVPHPGQEKKNCLFNKLHTRSIELTGRVMSIY